MFAIPTKITQNKNKKKNKKTKKTKQTNKQTNNNKNTQKNSKQHIVNPCFTSQMEMLSGQLL